MNFKRKGEESPHQIQNTLHKSKIVLKMCIIETRIDIKICSFVEIKFRRDQFDDQNGEISICNFGPHKL